MLEAGMPLLLQALRKTTRKSTTLVKYVGQLHNVTQLFVNSFCQQLGCGKLLETLPTRLAFDFEMVRTNDVVRVVVLENNPIAYPHKRIGSTVYTVIFESSLNVSISRREVLLSEQPTCVTTWYFFIYW